MGETRRPPKHPLHHSLHPHLTTSRLVDTRVTSMNIKEPPTTDSWSDRDQRIIVSQPAAGFLYDLLLRAKVDADPAEVYAVLTDPKSHEIFRGIKATLSRTTLEDDGQGRRKLLIGHRALTKFLWISVTFDTELFVWEDDVSRTIRFTNARNDGFMSKFDGMWHVQPFTQQTLDSIYRPQAAGAGQQQHQHSNGHNWLGSILHRSGSDTSSSSTSGSPSALVTLNQALAPRVRPPGPVAHLVRGLCGRVLHNMMEDLRVEVARRQQVAAAGQAPGSAGPQSRACSFSSSSSKSRQALGVPSLPVASLSLCSINSSSTVSPPGECNTVQEVQPTSSVRSSSSSVLALPQGSSSSVCCGLMQADPAMHITIKL